MKKIIAISMLILSLAIPAIGMTASDTNQIKIIEGCNNDSVQKVEEETNKFLKEKPIRPRHIVDIKLSTTSALTSRMHYICTTVIIIYREN